MREFISYEPGSPDLISLYMRVCFCFGCCDPLGSLPPHSFRAIRFHSVDGTRNACQIILSNATTRHGTELQYLTVSDARLILTCTVQLIQLTQFSPTKATEFAIFVYLVRPKFKITRQTGYITSRRVCETLFFAVEKQ